MSYLLRVKTPALGFIDIPNYQALSFGQEFSDVSGIDITYAKNGVNAEHLKDESIVVVFWDDDELDGCRYIMQTGDKDKDPSEPYFNIKGKSNLDVFRRVVVRRTANPGLPVTFGTSTPGFILKTFIDAAKARGRLVGITYNFSATVDSNNRAWPTTYTTEYKPGLTYLQVIQDLVDKGFIEVVMKGDVLNAYVAETMGVDRTLQNPPVELRYGLDYNETPNKWSSEVRAGYSLTVGDEGNYAEFEDNTVAAGPYGRPEQAISQGGVSDYGALNLINLYNLQNASTTTEQYTRRVILREGGYVPGVDYKVGDWIYDRVQDTPQRYRLLSIVTGVEDGALVDAAIVLNDKFMEGAVRTQRKIEGITGGGSSNGSGGGIPTNAPDLTTPKPPTGVGSTSGSYVDPVDGSTKVVVSTSWNAPTQNTDNSQLTDLDGYQTEYRTSKQSSYGALTDWYPARTDLTLQSRFDRRGKDKVNNWVGADGGASARSAAGEDWFFWSDTSWGTMSKTGVINLNSMPRNTITISDPTSGSDLRGHAGKINLVPEGIALLTDAANTWSKANCTSEMITAPGGFENRWYKAIVSATATSIYTYRVLPQGTLVGGRKYLAVAKIDSGTAAIPRFYVSEYNASGGQIAGTSKVVAPDANGWARVLFTAHPDATTCYTMLHLGGSTAVVGQWAAISMIGVFETDHALQSWQPPTHHEDIFNEVTNPDGKTTSTQSGEEVRRNYVTNPALYKDLSGWAGTNATILRDESDVYGEAPRTFLPEVTNQPALSQWYASLGQAGTRSVGIAVIGDSATESTGDPSNPNLADRYIERLQARLRKETAVSGVPINPKGYYGASTYIPAGYVHGGPVDWVFTASDPSYPISPLQSGLGGAGGRVRNLTAGVRATLTATFDKVRLSFGRAGFARQVAISIDGTLYTTLNTNGPDGSRITWTSPDLPRAEHVVSLEYVPLPSLDQGHVSLYGADIWDRDYNKGVRVYDLSSSGKAAQDAARVGSQEVGDGMDRGKPIDLLAINLGFNDAGRDAAWGGPRTAAQFKTDIQTIISRARATGFVGPTLLIGQWQAPQLTTTEPQANYRAKLKEIANSDSKVAFIDLSTVMPYTDYAPWGQESMYVDGLHPSIRGMERIAEVLHGVLSPTNTQLRPASARVTVTNASAQRGVAITPEPNPAWTVGTTYVCGVWVKAPDGARMQFRYLAVGNGGGTINFIGTGKWQWIESAPLAVAAGSTAGPYLIVRTETAQSLTFWVTKALISRTSGPYFDGNTPATDTEGYSWAGTPGSSASVAVGLSSVSWTAATPATIKFDSTKRIDGDGSVCVQSLSSGSAIGVNYGQISTLAANKYTTVIASVAASFPMAGAKVELLDASNNVLATETATYLGGNGWIEARLNYFHATNVPRSVRISSLSSSSIPAGSKMWVTELTVVSHDTKYWRGTPFHGGQNGAGITTSWLGTAHASRSYLEAYNSSSTPSPGQMGALLHPAAAGGDVSEYLWITSAVKVPGVDRAIVIANGMRNRAVRSGGWNFQRNGSIYVIEYDMATKSIVTFKQWFDDITIQWGETCWFDGSYFYVYGSSGTDLAGKAHVMRVPASDPINGARQFWTGTEWSGPGKPATLATFASQGAWTAVRTFNGKWIALFTSGHMDQMDGWTANAPQGPWTRVGIVHKFTEDHTVSLKYVPRFHPQLDSNERGIAISYSAAGQNGNTKYGAEFLRGPAGNLEMSMEGSDWLSRDDVDASPHVRGGFSSGYLYAPRVRAYDRSGNASEWAYGDPIYLTGDQEAPPQPSTPLVTPFLRGIRIVINGLTAAGGSQPRDFFRFAVHASYEEGFEPDESNLIDSIYTATGGTSVDSNLNWGAERYIKIVTWDTSGNQSLPSDVASAMAERLSDAYLPEKIIDGAKHIKDESVSVKQLTVGALDNSIVPNGNMEDWDGQSLFPSGWTAGWPRGSYTGWDTAATFAVDTTNPISGSKSLTVTPTAVSSRQIVSKQFPLTPGDLYYVKFVVRASRKLSGNYIVANLLAGETPDAINGFGDPRGAVLNVGSAGPGTEKYIIEGQVEIPDYFADGSGYAMRFGAIGIDCGHDGVAPYTAWIDDVEVRQVVGEAAIANASINRAKIRYLAVDDARIANVGVGKLVAGELWADITVSSRIMTSKTGQRVEINRDGLFGFNGANQKVTEVRSDDGGLVSRFLRTNTDGTRIELGTYSTMGAESALMAFFPATGTWQFPPAFGYGGEDRRPQWPGESAKVPGLAIHAGSKDVPLYNKHGMQMFSVDQAGGIVGVTGNKLDTSEATDGAPIRFNAGGSKGYVELLSGGKNSTDPAQLVLKPAVGDSYLALNKGGIRFANLSANDSYRMEFVYGTTWLGYNHLHIQIGGGGLRVSSSASPNAFIFKSGDLTLNSGEVYANSFRGPGNTATVLRTTSETSMRFDGDGNPITASGGHAQTAYWANAAGNMEGLGDWNVPRIKVRAQESYISWNAQGDAYVDGVGVKTFVIPHPVDEDKFLVHAAHEGDEMRVVYEGQSYTVNGEAQVSLPDYFDALTEDNTAVVLLSPMLCRHGKTCSCNVKHGPVDGNNFTVYANTDSHEVPFSWRVTAVRAGTSFDTEPLKADTVVQGNGPYTYIAQP